MPGEEALTVEGGAQAHAVIHADLVITRAVCGRRAAQRGGLRRVPEAGFPARFGRDESAPAPPLQGVPLRANARAGIRQRSAYVIILRPT